MMKRIYKKKPLKYFIAMGAKDIWNVKRKATA